VLKSSVVAYPRSRDQSISSALESDFVVGIVLWTFIPWTFDGRMLAPRIDVARSELATDGRVSQSFVMSNSRVIPSSPHIRLTSGTRLKLLTSSGESVTSRPISPPSERILCSNTPCDLLRNATSQLARLSGLEGVFRFDSKVS
jgi:hypothetical protein